MAVWLMLGSCTVSLLNWRRCPTRGIHVSCKQDLASCLCVDSDVGLTGSAGDGARRAERFGSNRLASREEITFGQLVLDALQVTPVRACAVARAPGRRRWKRLWVRPTHGWHRMHSCLWDPQAPPLSTDQPTG